MEMNNLAQSDDSDRLASRFFQQSVEAGARHKLEDSATYCRKAAELWEASGSKHVSKAYHQLGMIAYAKHEYGAAEDWYQRALEKDEECGDAIGAAKTLNNLGAVACARKDYAAAEVYLRKSITIKEDHGDNLGVARSLHQLGIVESRRGDVEAARELYFKAIEINLKSGNEVGVARNYGNLVTIARSQGLTGDKEVSGWFEKALHIFQEKGDVNAILELGKIAEHYSDWKDAEIVYRTAAETANRSGDLEYKAYSYQSLGALAARLCDYEAALSWYREAMQAHEERGATDCVAKACMSMGNLELARSSSKRPDFRSSKKWFQKAIELGAATSWRERLTIYGRLWRYRFANYFSKQ